RQRSGRRPEEGTMKRLTPRSVRPLRLGLFVLAALVPLFAIVVLFHHGTAKKEVSAIDAGAPNADTSPASRMTGKAARSKRHRDTTPTASAFAESFVGASNQYAKKHGDPARLAHPHCVKAAPGRYMCAYTVVKPGARNECHLMQARWTPNSA